jgi:[acyl-carrier-protein] S-malonyltransferase
MQPAAERLQKALAGMSFNTPQIPVINNVDVAPVTDPDVIKAALVRQAAAPVRWVETMRTMQAAGITHVFECGPGKVLAGLTKRCADGLAGGAMNDLAGVEATLAAVKE